MEATMNDKSHKIECQAREVVAWFRSGNSIPVDPVAVVNKEKFREDIDKLDKLVNN